MFNLENYKTEVECRAFIEKNDEWRKWSHEIPFINFKSEWLVRVIPPFAGAIVRFIVAHKNNPDKHISVYLDCYDRLGYFESPYWEMYPRTYEGSEDVARFSIENVDQLLGAIEDQLKIMAQDVL